MLHRCLAFALIAAWLPAIGATQEIAFNRDVRPILSDACFFCHGPDANHRESDLRLDIEAAAKDHAIVAGDAAASELVARITSDDDDLRMPPPESGKRLTQAQIDLLTRWVDQGAAYEVHWAYVQPKSHPVPQLNSDWPKDSIDQFILSKLRSKAMSEAEDADPSTLIRRVTFDLTGLPPSPQQVQAFISNPNPAAYSRYVDQLLASPAFGERMAIYWLDLVRYADTVGYHGDQDHNISPYRDYVIDAFNDDLPLDQFTREQIAGDLLPVATESQLVATGYNRLLQTSHEGGVQPKEYLAIYAADRIRNLSNVWLGATVGCAQCHDHKYDPYTLRDFYSLAAFFADVDEDRHFKVGSNALPTKRPPEIPVLSKWQRNRLSDLQTQLTKLTAIRRQTGADDDTTRRKIAELQDEQQSIDQSARMTMVTQSIQPRQIRVLPRGDWLDDSGDVVMPAVPTFLGQLQTDGRATRLDLANWLVDCEQGVGGLTARVFVNRLWYLMFGRGISSSLDDFGGQGQPPTHAELLDQLAVDFVNDGWSVKRMIRRIVLSRAYRQSSVATDHQLRIDPDNQWFGRQSRYRLPAEMVRDCALETSGLLVRYVGGASIKPHQPAGYYRHLNFPRRLYTPDRGSGQYRRGVYVHWQRQFLHPMLKAMDAPSREECTAQRPRSNTPLEALAMLNDPSLVDAAIALASRLTRGTAGSDSERIAAGFQLVVSRLPDDSEIAALQELLDSEREYYGRHIQDATSMIESADSAIDVEEVDPPELASWTSVARAIMNLYETVTRN